MIIYSEPKTTSDLPVIDIGLSVAGDKIDCEMVSREIGKACQDTGFFYITNHGVDQTLIDGTLKEASRFFDQPETWKKRWKKQGHSNGYEPPETQRLDNESPGDIKESFNFTLGNIPGTDGYKENIWPDDFPGFRDQLESYKKAVWQVGLQVSRLISLSLGMPFDYFDPSFSQQKSPLRILRYPPHPKITQYNQLGCGAHTDWGWITLLLQDNAGGLEVETASGEWVRVEPIPGTFVVNLGDIMLRWTNSKYHSSLHRVMNNNSGRNRHSIVLFFNQAHNTHVECLPSCLSAGEKPIFLPCTAGEHSTQRYKESRSNLEKTN